MNCGKEVMEKERKIQKDRSAQSMSVNDGLVLQSNHAGPRGNPAERGGCLSCKDFGVRLSSMISNCCHMLSEPQFSYLPHGEHCRSSTWHDA